MCGEFPFLAGGANSPSTVNTKLNLCREERGANTEPTGLGMERW